MLESFRTPVRRFFHVFPYISSGIGVVSLSIGAYLFFVHPPSYSAQPSCATQEQPQEQEEASVSAQPKQAHIYVSGAVQKPGVYSFDEDTMVQAVIEKAGGFSKTADSYYLAKSLNLSRKVSSEEHLYIPSKDEDITLAQICSERKIPVNTATVDEIQRALEIGETRAKTIVDRRPYLSFDDFSNRLELPKSVLDLAQSRLLFSTD